MKIEKALSARQRALETYYRAPKICMECQSIIEVRENEKVSNTRRKKFCNKTCSASYNNRLYPKREATRKTGTCKECGKEFPFKQMPNGRYGNKAQFCLDCRRTVQIRTLAGGKLPEEKTKKELYGSVPVSLYARTSITQMARKKYIKSGRPLVCKACGYTTHVQICHKRAIESFPETALIGEINDFENLVALCPNHHWEFDHQLLSLDSGSIPLTATIDHEDITYYP